MSQQRGMSPSTIMVSCAPEDLATARAVAQRLRVDGLNPWLAADELGDQREQVRALREAVRGAAAVVICLSRRAWGGDGRLIPALAKLVDLLNLTPGRRLVLALKLARCELPPELGEAEAVELFAYSGYERLRERLREELAATRVAAPEPPAPEPPRPASPALALRARLALPSLERQGQLRRLGRGVARGLLLLDARQALLTAGGGATLVDLRDGAPIWTIDSPTRCAALSKSGSLLALAGNSQIQLWDLAGGRLLASCTGHSGPVSGLAFAPDERTLASAAHDGTLRLWRLTDAGGLIGGALATLPAHSDHATSVAFSPDGALLATGGADRTVRIWRTFDRAPVKTLAGHGGAVESLAFSPDGALLAAGSRGRSVRVWEVAGWRERPALEGHGGAVESLAFSPDSALLATGAADHSARIWRMADGALTHALSGHSGAISGVCFSADGRSLATLSEDAQLLVHSLDGGEPRSLRPLSNRVTTLAFSPDGALLAVGAADGATLLYGAAGEAPAQTRYQEHRGAISALAFAAPRRLISTGVDRTVRAFSTDSGAATILLQTHGAQQATALAPGGRLLASSDGETTVQLWRLSAAGDHPGGQFWRVLRGLRSRARLVGFAPDDGALAVASDDGAVQLWRVADLEAERDLPAMRVQSEVGRVRCLAFSADGALLAAGGDQGTTQIWRADGAEAARLPGQGAAIQGAAFSRDGRVLATGDAAGTIMIWRLPVDAQRRRPPAPATTIAGHAGAVCQLAFSPTGGILVSGSSDGTVRLWRV